MSHPITRLPFARALTAVALAGLLAGCATGPDADPRDPLEPFNRGVQRFNDTVDDAVLKPVAQGYVAVTPSPVRTGVSNFFSNLGDLWSAVNAGLQLRPRETAENLMRFSVNTVLADRFRADDGPLGCARRPLSGAAADGAVVGA
jgi:phospholipid-binding lipoprotein MlaA